MPNTHPTGGACNRDVSKAHPRLFSIPDGRRGTDCSPRPPTPSLRLRFAPARSWQPLLDLAARSHRSPPAAFGEGSIDKATPRAVRHDRVDPTWPKADAQSPQFLAARHRPPCLCAACGLYRSIAPSNPIR